MHYPPGTSFAVNKSLLSRSTLHYKLTFKEGVYLILHIKKIEDRVQYTFNYNGREKVVLLFNNCNDVDRIIAFCRNEKIKEPVETDDLIQAND